MTFRLSLLSAAAITALFAHNAAQAENRNFSSCDGSSLSQVQCVANHETSFGKTHGLRDNDQDHHGDKGDPKGSGKDKGKDSGDAGGTDGAGGDGGPGGGNGGGEGGGS